MWEGERKTGSRVFCGVVKKQVWAETKKKAGEKGVGHFGGGKSNGKNWGKKQVSQNGLRGRVRKGGGSFGHDGTREGPKTGGRGLGGC